MSFLEVAVERLRAAGVLVRGSEQQLGLQVGSVVGECPGCARRGGDELLRVDRHLCDQRGHTVREQGYGSVTLPNGLLRPIARGKADVCTGLGEKAGHRVHASRGCVDTLREVGEEEAQDPEDRLARVQTRVATLKMSGLELPALNLQVAPG